ncbi:MAG: hypothetical protein ACI9DJ_003013 [Algoriphagus sp.]
MLAEDRRTNPIIGFSKKSTFDIKGKNLPKRLQFWLDNSKKYMMAIRNSIENEKESAWKMETIAWTINRKSENLNLSNSRDDSPGGGGCTPYTYTKSPLLSTT